MSKSLVTSAGQLRCSDTDSGGERAATIYTLIGRTKLSGVETEACLRTVHGLDSRSSDQSHHCSIWNLSLSQS
jgi:hypothetical protein